MFRKHDVQIEGLENELRKAGYMKKLKLNEF